RHVHLSVSFFFQAEDGIRDFHVTGVQTCALPISRSAAEPWSRACCANRTAHAAVHARAESPRASRSSRVPASPIVRRSSHPCAEIGRASCRERAEVWGGAGRLSRKTRRG